MPSESRKTGVSEPNSGPTIIRTKTYAKAESHFRSLSRLNPKVLRRAHQPLATNWRERGGPSLADFTHWRFKTVASG